MQNRQFQSENGTYQLEFQGGRPDQCSVSGPLANNTKVCTITDLLVRIGRPQGQNVIRTIYSVDAKDNEGRLLKPVGIYDPEKIYATVQPQLEGESPSNYELYIQSLGKILIPLLVNNMCESEGISKPYTTQEINTIMGGVIQLANGLNL